VVHSAQTAPANPYPPGYSRSRSHHRTHRHHGPHQRHRAPAAVLWPVLRDVRARIMTSCRGSRRAWCRGRDRGEAGPRRGRGGDDGGAGPRRGWARAGPRRGRGKAGLQRAGARRGRGKSGPRRGWARAWAAEGKGQGGATESWAQAGPRKVWRAKRPGQGGAAERSGPGGATESWGQAGPRKGGAAERLGPEGRRGWGQVMPVELLEGDRTPKPAPTVSATGRAKPGTGGFRGVVPPGQHCGALGEGRPKGERAAFAAAWGYVDLNHGPRPYQGRALTD
jgi:hypothetical protein